MEKEFVKKWYKPSEIDLTARVGNPPQGSKLGYSCLENLYTALAGGFTMIYGPPSSGKTRLHFQFLVNQVKAYSNYHVIYSPETGEKEEVKQLLMAIMWGKKFYDMTLAEVREAEKMVDRFFFIVDDYDLTYKDLFNQAVHIERKQGIKVASVTADPHNTLTEMEFEGVSTEAKRLGATLKFVKVASRKMQWHTYILSHVRDMVMEKVEYSDGTKRLTWPMANMGDLLGGQEPSRHGEMMVSLWRPKVYYDLQGNPTTMMHDGYALPANAVFVSIQKVKPEEAGEWGTAMLFYDKSKQQYYEHLGGQQLYGLEYKNL